MVHRKKLIVILTFTTFGCSGPVSTGTVSDGNQVPCGSPPIYEGWKEGNLPPFRNTVYDNVSKTINRETFQILKCPCYAKDDKSVFFEGTKIHVADASSFEAISQGYGKDKYRGYYLHKPIDGSCGNTFRVLDTTSGKFSTDGNDVFFEARAMHVSDAGNFRIIERGCGDSYISTDGKCSYYNEFRMPSLDISTLELLRGCDGIYKDKNWVYQRNRKLNYNYKGQWIIDTIDASTFRITNLDGRGKDKFGWIALFRGRLDSGAAGYFIAPAKRRFSGRITTEN